jgi:hypothetical protein
MASVTATYWELPLGLPQRLDAVVVRHARLESLRAHNPMPGTFTLAILTTSGCSLNAVRRHDSKELAQAGLNNWRLMNK